MERYLVEQCSPTLASLKTANLFSYAFSSEEELFETVAYWNECMKRKGVSVCILKVRERTALIYVYRRTFLMRDMQRAGVSCFLCGLGYESIDADEAVEHLKERLQSCDKFPHEIGLFLGYPLEDVIGFVENCGRNSLFCGCWKVYSNVGETMRRFQKFKKCTAVYTRLWSQGERSVFQLTVAA